MPRERWIERARARARDLRDAAQAARARRPPAAPPVETGADPDHEHDAEEIEPAAPAAGIEQAEPASRPTAAKAEPPGMAPDVPATEAEQAKPAADAPPLEGEDAAAVDPRQQPLPLGDSTPGPWDAAGSAPSPHSTRGRLGGAAAGLGERVSGYGHGARGVFSDVRHWSSQRWHSIPLIARQRIGAAVILVAVVALIVLVLVPAAPCSFPGGDECAPGDDAIGLVPADALAYAHVDIDPESDQFATARELADRLPLLSAIVTRPLTRVGRTPFDFATDVEPWAGGEAAVALLPSGARPAAVTLIEVDDPGGAERFAAGLLGPRPTESDVGGVKVSVGARGRAAAQVNGFLVLGDEQAVSEIVDPPEDAGKLETSEAAESIDQLPDDRLAYAYLSGTGARAVLSRPSLRPLDTFVDSAATAGVAAALSFDGDVASVTVRSRLDPDRAESAPGFFAALPSFAPTLASDIGPDALAYLGIGDPESSVRSLLSQAATEAPVLHRAYVQAAKRLRKDGDVSVTRDLLPLLGSQVALSVEPVAAKSPSTPGVVAAPGVPYVLLLAEGLDSERAAADLALLQKPLTEALVPKGGEVAGRVSAFESLQIAGIEAQGLTVSPNVELTYATYDDRLAVATDPLGIAQARAGGGGLASAESFARVTEGFPDQVSLITYLDLRDLISLGEQVGLAADPGYATFAPDLRTLDAAALAVSDSDGVIRTDARLAIGDPQPAEVDSPPLPGE